MLSTIRIVLSVYAVGEQFFSWGNLIIYMVVALTGGITTWVGVQTLRKGTKEAKRAAYEAQESAENKARLALLDPYLATIEHLDKYGDSQGIRVDRLMEDLLECEEKNRELTKQLALKDLELEMLSRRQRRHEQFLLDMERRKSDRTTPGSSGSSGSSED